MPVLSILVAISLTTMGMAASRDTTKAKETELKQVRERIESVRKSIQADAERRDSLAGELKQADENIQQSRSELAEIRARRQSSEQQLKTLQAEQTTAQAKLQMERESLARELRLSYMNGRNEQLKLLLNQQDPAQLGRMLSYYGYFGRARAEHIKTINEQLAHLELLASEISAETDKLRGIEAENERSARNLAQARQRRASTLAQVESKLKTGNQRLGKLQSDAQSLERLIDELRKAMEKAAAQAQNKSSKPSAAPTGRGSWPWPVKGEVLARFGQLRSGGPLKWEGLMIGSSAGAQVRAPAAGRVLYADWLPGLGLLMVLDHGGGIMSLYGHNEQLYKKVGEQVSAGDLLAAVGDSGINGRAGLYLEIRNGKQPVDPLNWLGKP
ncbi:MAG: peptidoglycan DD-metalloendopeptidase family protein [Steroidobacteraceae bacterium]